MAQPNFQILSDSVVASAQQLALMPNLPVLNFGGQLLQIQQSLQEIQQTMRQQGQQLAQQGEQLAQQGQQLAQQGQQLAQQGQQLAQQGQQLTQQGQQLVQHGEELVHIRQEISRSYVYFLVFRFDRPILKGSREHNNFARLLNSSVNRSDTRLEVLYGLNNQPVQGFPETGADIGALTGMHPMSVLNH
jgi:septal ring factor EnvC (AmiA/AmiB activator)